MEFILNIFSNLLLFLSFTLEKLVPIFSILFSGAFAGLIVQYWIRLYMKYDKVQKLLIMQNCWLMKLEIV